MESKRKPSHPGRILKSMYMTPMKLSVTHFAKELHISRKTLSKITNGHGKITSDMALRLGKALGTSFLFWLNLQCRYDLCLAKKNNGWKEVIVLR